MCGVLSYECVCMHVCIINVLKLIEGHVASKIYALIYNLQTNKRLVYIKLYYCYDAPLFELQF